MKPWELNRTVEKFRNMSGDESLKMGIELSETSLLILADSIRNENPEIHDEEIKKKIRFILWDEKR
ncbi:MAG: hypothetical protein QME42_04425 [bacterium]|nr:hypothetical protein [bacterium]